MNKEKKRKLKKKSEEVLLKQVLEEYDQVLDNQILINKSIELLKKMDTKYNHNDLIVFNALSLIMEQRYIKKYETESYPSNKFYPDFQNPKFNEVIYKKKEFYINKIRTPHFKTEEDKEAYSQQLCNPLEASKDSRTLSFNLTQNQKFIKTFMSPNTPYNGLLLFHGTGVGKTCSSISIAEQYSDELNKLNKKIIILLNPSIKANFMKNIFDINKLKKKIPKFQCLGDTYLKGIDVPNEINSEQFQLLEKKIKKIINKKYNFIGYRQFGNIINKLITQINDRYSDPQQRQTKLNQAIKKAYSNTFMIIDEAHNIKEGNDDLKLVPPLLELVVKNAVNMKLLLLTATPMFDNSTEIIFLLNLLLLNDKRQPLILKDYFNKDATLKPDMESEFTRKIRGYISYMRGDDPYRFPSRIYPNELCIPLKNMPIKNSKGIEIPEDDRIQQLKIVGCPMIDDGFQINIYNKLDGGNFGEFNQSGIMTSNIVFPNDDDSLDVKQYIGDIGFNRIFKKNKIGSSIKYEFIEPRFTDLFENLNNYSSKLHQIIENVNNSEGIVFIYSQYINSGIVPLALALEYNGYSKYDGSILVNKPKQTSKGNYIIISGNSDLSKNTYAEYIKIQDKNIDGNKVKIILGSETAAEGLDFTYIREVHILDPWFHLNKMEQIIGRGIRNCSHIKLPKEKRNVKVFIYATTKSDIPKNDNETLDLYIYRQAELKSKKMANIEYIIKKNAVDCNLNLNGNVFDKENDGTKKCNYKVCNYTCNGLTNNDVSNEDLDTSTFNKEMVIDSINQTKNLIIKKYRFQVYFKIEELLEQLNVDKDLLYFALTDLMFNKTKIFNEKINNYGSLKYYNNYYILNEINKTKFITSNNIFKSKKEKFNRINISNINIKNTKNTKKINTVNTNTKNTINTNTKNTINTNIIDLSKETDFYDFYVTNKSIKKTEKNFIFFQLKNLNFQLKNNNLIPIKKYLDYLPINEKQKLTEYLIKTHYSDDLSIKIKPHEQTLLDTLNTILYINNDIHFNDSKYKDNSDIWGYKILVDKDKFMYYKFNKDTQSFNKLTVSDPDYNNIRKSNIKKIEDFSKTKLPNIIGYVEFNSKKNLLLFKIKEIPKVLNTKKTKIKTGLICNNDGMTKNKILDYIKILNPTYSDKFPTRDMLCFYLEFLLREKDGFFYSPEQIVEYKLNKK